MQTKGMIRSVFASTLVLEVDQTPNIEVGEVVDIEIKKHREKRSKDANAYFHVLCDKLSKALNISFTSCKNMLITSYGQILFFDDVPATVKSNIPPEYVQEIEAEHMKLIQVDADGVFWYRVYRGSHTYNTLEMSQLIDGTVSECKLQNIETATPDEIARMMAVWNENQKHCI